MSNEQSNCNAFTIQPMPRGWIPSHKTQEEGTKSTSPSKHLAINTPRHEQGFQAGSSKGSLLKVWFVSKRTGVVGVFNSQGTGWCKVKKKTRIHDVSPSTLTCSVQATDVDVIAQVAEPDWNGGTVFYSQRSGIGCNFINNGFESHSTVNTDG
ncbi:hypothetical protein RJ639_017475 [Escallonia herrerae]|uniref:Uncharacterized protein n=1 Tax=Escallonia herrerae TaxID=1293975 RepID=A0AA88VH59_9ASTE|nr:hypothetical protein RJ639_017475 [Escallonia herrerae]